MKRSSIILLAFFMLLSGFAPAATYIYDFSGTISYITFNENNVFPVALHDTFSASMQLEDIADLDPAVARGDYTQNASISLTLPSISFSFVNQLTNITVDNNFGTFTQSDAFRFIPRYDWRQAGFNFESFAFQMSDSSALALDSTRLPTDLSAQAFDYRYLILQGNSVTSGDDFHIFGTIETISVTVVPEPASLLLLAWGGWLLRKRRP